MTSLLPGRLIIAFLVLNSISMAEARSEPGTSGLYFPPPGQNIENQNQRGAVELGLDASVVARINQFIAENPYTRRKVKPRWALWRHGYLVHVEGDFHETVDVASLRKTWHAMIVGAAIQQQRISSHHQKIQQWLPELEGNDADATWRDVITQSAGFDYPYGSYRDYFPGQMWTYSDLNLVHLCNALARSYGRQGYHDDYAQVARQAYFDAIGMEGWSTTIKVDSGFGSEDGVRFVLSLEHMGRLGLLALARGQWNGVQLVPRWFVEELETKQTYGMSSNYEGPNDGTVGLRDYPDRFAESPYGYLTWVNTDRDYFPDADHRWAWGSGAGGSKVLWNRGSGIVYAGVGIEMTPERGSIPRILESAITAPNPLYRPTTVLQVGLWDRFEKSIINSRRYDNPFTDVVLNVTYTRPDGNTTKFWGFHDGAAIWRIRFMPDQIGRWKFRAEFSDGSRGSEGEFDCVASSIPGMISRDESNPIWFGFKGGRHVVLRSLHVGDRFFAENWPAPKRRSFLDWAEAQGYNMLSVASHYLNRDAAGRGRGWVTPDLWPPNAAEYRKLELMLDDLSGHGIVVYPFAGFFGQSSDFPTERHLQELYIKYMLARLGPYWNVVFNVAGPEPMAYPKRFRNAMTADDVRRLGNNIAKLDPFGHLLSIHNRPGDDPFRDEQWMTFGTLQGWKNTDWSGINAGMRKNHYPSKPLYAQEVFWPGNKHNSALTDDEIRMKAFVLLMSGAAINFGDMDGDSSSGFSGSMELSDRKQHRHDIVRGVWDFFETVPFYRMRPRQDLVDRGFCLAEDGVQYLVYLEAGGAVSVSVKGGPYTAAWIKARDPQQRKVVEKASDGRNLRSPSDDDWLLHLNRLDP